MARKTISEFIAKKLLSSALAIPFEGEQIKARIQNENDWVLDQVQDDKRVVIKVDQGVKGRFKKGLVAVDKSSSEIHAILKDWQNQGYSQFFIEPYISHDPTEEKYLSIERVRDGYKVLYSDMGGIHIESHANEIKEEIIPYQQFNKSNNLTKIEKDRFWSRQNDGNILKLLKAFDDNYFSFLEINPLLVRDGKLLMLDAAVEVDSTADFFVHGAWTPTDYTDNPLSTRTPEEDAIIQLGETSQSAFNLTVLNPQGSLFMLLSGGGASIVLADEAYNQGYGKEIANYGEYSGNPTTEETYEYTKQLLSLLLKSEATKKALIIAGGVANFTDIRLTFKGVVQAINEQKKHLQEQNVRIFVRRGGPHQKAGLENMRTFLEKEDLLGHVAGPEMVLTEIVTKALVYVHGM